VRIVIDTNIWVSGLLWRGMPWKLLCLAETGKVELCMAPAMLDELAKVLSYERLQPRLAQLGLTTVELVTYAMDLAFIFEVPEGPHAVVADPDDDIFLHCAAVADAACVVSGDNHLLDLGTYADIPILTIRDFFAKEFPDQAD
jgi:putative PIN family toxin of toxin-antitoxin system